MNKWKLYAICIAIALTAGMYLDPDNVNATLGESVSSVDNDRDALLADRRTQSVREGYTVQEIHSPSVNVREYVSPSGVVFGIAWNGLVHPDLRQLLGSYAEEYRDASQKSERRPGSRSIRIKTKRLLVEQWGHMRDLHGRAYDPALIPEGVEVDEIK